MLLLPVGGTRLPFLTFVSRLVVCSSARCCCPGLGLFKFVCPLPSDDAYKIAQGIGVSDSLCEPDNPFRLAYNACETCVQASYNLAEGDDRRSLDTEFENFLNYCDLSVQVVSATCTLTNGQVTAIVHLADPSSAPETTSRTTSSRTSKRPSTTQESQSRTTESLASSTAVPGLDVTHQRQTRLDKLTA